MLSLKFHFLFIHVPKTGGNSIQRALEPYSEDELISKFDFQDGKERFDIRNKNFPYSKHASLGTYKSLLPELTYNSLTKFTVVRNPWDRMISRYFSPHEGREDFDKSEFQKVIMESQPLEYYVDSFPYWYRFLPVNPLKNSEIDHFLRFENLESDFQELSKFFGLKDLKLEKLNKSKRANYQYYYDASLKDMVYKKFKKEIEFFEYLF